MTALFGVAILVTSVAVVEPSLAATILGRLAEILPGGSGDARRWLHFLPDQVDQLAHSIGLRQE